MHSLSNPKDERVNVEETPFIWEIENRDAFKTVGGVFNSCQDEATPCSIT